MSDYLPMDVILLVLDKISDPKSLIMCSLLSKTIASTLSERRSINIRFPPLLSSAPSWNIILTNDVFDRLTALLRRFDGVQSLRLEVPCTCRNYGDDGVLTDNFRWKAKIGCQLEIFSYLSLDSIKYSEHPPNTEDMSEGDFLEEFYLNNDEDNLVGHSYHELFGPRRMAMCMHRLMLMLIAHHSNLQDIEITESDNHGILAINHEGILNVRNALAKDTLSSMLFSSVKYTHFVVWYEYQMKLKLSGTHMAYVRLVICTNRKSKNETDESNGYFHTMSPTDFDIDAALLGGFTYDQDGVFAETMSQLLSEHKMKTMVNAWG